MDEKEAKPRYARTLMELLKYPAPPVEDRAPFESIKEMLEYYRSKGTVTAEEETTLRIGYYDLPEA